MRKMVTVKKKKFHKVKMIFLTVNRSKFTVCDNAVFKSQGMFVLYISYYYDVFLICAILVWTCDALIIVS